MALNSRHDSEPRERDKESIENNSSNGYRSYLSLWVNAQTNLPLQFVDSTSLIRCSQDPISSAKKRF